MGRFRSFLLRPIRLVLREAVDSWNLPVASQQVTRCCIDYSAVSLLLSNGVSVYIEGRFVYAGPGGAGSTLDPDGEASALAPVVRLRRLLVADAKAYKDGSLEMQFEDGSRIFVPADQQYEAWTLSGPGGPDGLKVVSMPGGELAIWTDRR